MTSSDPVAETKGRVVMAPNPYTKTGPTIFLSGSIDTPPATWQSRVTSLLSSHPITILNPHREDWDSSWIESPSFPPFAEQTKWELQGMENADVIAVFLGKAAKAPISMMELGLWARSGKVVVCVQKGFWKEGNVRIVCERYGLHVCEEVGELAEKVLEMLRERTGLEA